MMKIVALLLILAGALAAIAAPLYSQSFSGEEIGTFPMFRRGETLSSPTIYLGKEEQPAIALLHMSPLVAPVAPLASATVQFEVVREETGFFDKQIIFNPQPTDENVSAPDPTVVQKLALQLFTIEPGDYTFRVRLMDEDGIDVEKIDMELRRNVVLADDRLQPLGFITIALGFLILIITVRRRPAKDVGRPQQNWGRGN